MKNKVRGSALEKTAGHAQLTLIPRSMVLRPTEGD